MNLILGNLFSLLAMLADSFSSSRKTVKGMLLVQCLGQFFYILCSLALKGYSAVVQNVVSILRNCLAISKYQSKALEWALVISGVVFGIIFNNLGVFGWLPILANLEYTLAIFYIKDNERMMKVAFMINAFLFAIFNAVILNFVGIITNMIIVVVTLSFLIKSAKQAK